MFTTTRRTRASRSLSDDPSAGGEMVAHNHFASLVKVQAPRRCIGTEVQFRDVVRPPPRRILIDSLGDAPTCGAAIDDEVVAFDNKSVRRSSAAELVASARAGDGEISMLVWGLRGHHGCYGFQFPVYCTALDIDLGEIPAPRCVDFDGTVVAVVDMNTSRLRAARGLGIERGDILIGINHEPLPDHEPRHVVVKRIRDNLILGPVVLNFWRCTDDNALYEIQRSAVRATRIERARQGGFDGRAAQLELSADNCVSVAGCQTGFCAYPALREVASPPQPDNEPPPFRA
ncbi:hypothetical protein CTAYLR_010242 [Chrysophaeum taylorii]|uniref:PDZ domain-containing protein n=1 Tax=Chrysophaeum taylorii TaxID=2483200 RepID=A0AAD7UL20_9STRA|nr:hypothetical protein CTAYLR_010242 [Chrysophaeum taylorii]